MGLYNQNRTTFWIVDWVFQHPNACNLKFEWSFISFKWKSIYKKGDILQMQMIVEAERRESLQDKPAGFEVCKTSFCKILQTRLANFEDLNTIFCKTSFCNTSRVQSSPFAHLPCGLGNLAWSEVVMFPNSSELGNLNRSKEEGGQREEWYWEQVSGVIRIGLPNAQFSVFSVCYTIT